MSKKVKSKRFLGSHSDEPRLPFSRDLRQIHHLLGQRKREDSLRELAIASRRTDSEVQLAQIANLVAKSQFELGRYEDAMQRYRHAARLGAKNHLDPQKFLGPSLGVIRCLLKDQKLEDALNEADNLAALVIEKEEEYQAKTTINVASLVGQEAVIPARPLRPSVALTKIGVCFLEEGYLEAGKHFLEKVLVLNPNGASRARQFLASALLLESEFDRAETLARESIVCGEFRAKTIPSWQILIRARKAMDKPLLDPELYRGFREHHCNGRVAARTESVIIAELRRQNDNSWHELAARWVNDSEQLDPVIRVEVMKMMLSEYKTGGAQSEERPQAMMRLAQEIFQEPTLTPTESVGIAKTFGEVGLEAGYSFTQLYDLVDQVRSRYNIRYGISAFHSFGLGLAYTNHYAEARVVFSKLISHLPRDTGDWGRAVWTLARIESSDGNHSESADLYLKYARNRNFPASLRLQSFLRWICEAERSGESIDIELAHRQIDSLLADMQEYRPLLDAARQLRLAGARFNSIFEQVSMRAEMLALDEFEQATTTEEALTVLLPLSRRQYYDFASAGRVIEIYEGFTPEKMNWLWSKDARFWEYLSLVMRSYLGTKERPKGEELGRSALEDPTTPAVGRVYLSVHYALWLIETDQTELAFTYFENAIEQGPSQRLTANAYYWKALVYHINEQGQEAQSALLQVRRCLLPKPSFYTEWELDAKAGLLLREYLDPGSIDLGLYSEDFLASQRSGLLIDMKAAS